MALKGFIFTLDSIFALIVALTGVSILLYANYTASGFYIAPSVEAATLLQSLLQSNIATSAGGSAYAKYLSNAAAGLAFDWQQFGHDGKLTSASAYGAGGAYLLYQYKAPDNINPVVVAGHGIVAFAAGKNVIALNASNGTVVAGFPLSTGASTISPPLVYNNELVFADSSGVVRAVSAYNGLNALWTSGTIAAPSGPLAMIGGYVALTSSNSVYLINPLNGTQQASLTVPIAINVQTPAYANGEILVATAPSGATNNRLYSYSLAGGTLTGAWNVVLSSSATTRPMVSNNTVAIGSGTTLYLMNLDGNVISKNTLDGQIIGLASSSGEVFAETAVSVYGFLPGSPPTQIFYHATQSDAENTTPSVGSGNIYGLVSSTQFQGYNITYNRQLWNVTMPNSYSYYGSANIALAYGKAFVPNGQYLYAFGTYAPQVGESTLASLANMYINGQGGYAGLLLNDLYFSNSSNIAVFINGSYAPALRQASFDPTTSSYITVPNSQSLTLGDNISISFWIYKGAYASSCESVMGKPGSSQLLIYSITVNGCSAGSESGTYLTFKYKDSGGTTHDGIGSGVSYGLSAQKWYHAVVTLGSGNVTWYINGVQTNQYTGLTGPAANTNPFYIGTGDGYFNGSLAGVQIYNATLTGPQVQVLYQRGAYGMPLLHSDLVGWWPLNGDANDYSGNFNDGFASSVTYPPSKYLPKTLGDAYQIGKASVPMVLNVSGSRRLYNVSMVSWK